MMQKKLNQIDKVKILEMVNLFFPEKNINSINECGFLERVEERTGSLNLDSKYQVHVQVCHWYEFCLEHLCKKVYKNNYFLITSFLNRLIIKKLSNFNLVTVLYEHVLENNYK